MLLSISHNLVKITNWLKKQNIGLNGLQLDTLTRSGANSQRVLQDIFGIFVLNFKKLTKIFTKNVRTYVRTFLFVGLV